MISLLTGQVLQVSGTWLILDVNGFGLKLFCAPRTAATLHSGQSVTLHTSLVVRAEAWTLYGFADADERDCFDLVQSASGIGPKTALAVVSVFSAAELRTAILAADVKALTQVPGIGNKGAQRLIIELKDKLGTLTSVTLPLGDDTPAWEPQVKAGLEGLGYSSKDADKALEQVRGQVAAGEVSTDIAVLLRAALRSLAK